MCAEICKCSIHKFTKFYRNVRDVLISNSVPRLMQLVAKLSPWRPRFSPKPVHVGFVVDKMTLGLVSVRVVWFFRVIIILLMLDIHSSVADSTRF
jgi:hypothetical protein